MDTTPEISKQLFDAPLLGSIPLQVIERGEADRIWHTCHGVTPWRRMIYSLQTGEPI